MSAISNENSIPAADVSAGDLQQVERALIDVSTRKPVLAFYASAVFWLLVQMVLGMVSALKIHWPEFLGDSQWLTYGHVVAAQNNVLVYGWASMAGMGTAIWLLARLCRVALPRSGILGLGVLLWNVGVACGVIGILAGYGRAFDLLEFPKSAMEILFVAYAIVGVWGMIIFANRRPGHVYISVWYLVSALLWFPWLLGGASVLLGRSGFHGVMQAVVVAWYAQNVIGLWLGALGLGTIYYLIPKVIGRPIHSYYLAPFGFWSFAVFSAWTGMQRLNGGPVPAWLVTVSVAAAILMLIPVAVVTANYFLTMQGNFEKVYQSPTLRFVIFGALAYALANVVFMIGSFRAVSAITQFTWFGVAQNQLFVCAFFSMVMFGAMYYIVPRLVGCEWLSSNLIQFHFWGVAYGFGMSVLMLAVAGVAQGAMQSTIHVTDPAMPQSDFLLSVSAMLPLLRGRTIAQVLICVGQLTFAIHFLLMLLRLGRPLGSKSALLEPIDEGANP